MSRRTKSSPKVLEKDASGSAADEAADRHAVDEEKSNGECEAKVSSKDAPGSAGEEASKEVPTDNGEANGESEVPDEISQDEPCTISEEPTKTERKIRG